MPGHQRAGPGSPRRRRWLTACGHRARAGMRGPGTRTRIGLDNPDRRGRQTGQPRPRPWRPPAAHHRGRRDPRGRWTPALLHHQRRPADAAPGHRPGRDQGMGGLVRRRRAHPRPGDRKSTRLNSSHVRISYAVFCLKKKKKKKKKIKQKKKKIKKNKNKNKKKKK